MDSAASSFGAAGSDCQAADLTGFVFIAGKIHDAAAVGERVTVGVSTDDSGGYCGWIVGVGSGESDIMSWKEEIFVIRSLGDGDGLARAAEEEGLLDVRDITRDAPMDQRIGDVGVCAAEEFDSIKDSVTVAVRIVGV